MSEESGMTAFLGWVREWVVYINRQGKEGRFLDFWEQ